MEISIVDHIYSIFGKKKVYLLRKKYDRLRERADRIGNRDVRFSVLGVLDQAERTLITMEEQNLTLGERRRMKRYVTAGMIKAREMIAQYEDSRKARREK